MTMETSGSPGPPLSDTAQRLRKAALERLLGWVEAGTRPQLNPTTGEVQDLPISCKEISECRAWINLLEQDGNESEFVLRLQTAAQRMLDGGRIKAPPKLEVIDVETE